MVQSGGEGWRAAEGEKAIADPWRRLAAFLVDALVIGAPMLLLGLPFFRWAASHCVERCLAVATSAFGSTYV
jgi:hypothetical protein